MKKSMRIVTLYLSLLFHLTYLKILMSPPLFGRVKLPSHPVQTGKARRGLPGNVISFYIVPLDPAYPGGGGTGHPPATPTQAA
jgi:hypothetical protein